MMSAFASLYGSPKASMISRDPDGVDPNGVDYSISAGLEPSGSRVEESVFSPSNGSHNYDMGTPKSNLSHLDVVQLVGAPPPPPKTPPPTKKHKNTRKNNGQFKAGETPRATNAGSSMSFDDDSLLFSFAETTPTAPSLDDATETDAKIPQTRTSASEDSHSTDGSLKVDSPPSMQEKVLSPSFSIVEERLKAAKAVYESQDLVLDEEPSTILSPAMKGRENQREIMPELAVTVKGSPKGGTIVNKPSSPAGGRVSSSPSSSKQSPRSHSSQATRTQGNKSLESSKSSPMSVFTNVRESPRRLASSLRAPSPPRQEQQPQPPPRTASVERRQHKEEKIKRDQKRGFFNKLFRGRNKASGDFPTAEDVGVPPVSLPSPRQIPSPRSHPSPRSKSKTSNGSSRSKEASPRSRSSPRSRPSPSHQGDERTPRAEKLSSPVMHSPAHSEHRQLKPALKSVEHRHYQGPALHSPFSQKPENIGTDVEGPNPCNVQPPSPSETETPRSNGESTEESSYEQQVPQTTSYSQDPPDDEHGDPPEFSGRPLISPTSIRHMTSRDEGEESRMVYVKSRLAEAYQGRSQVDEAYEVEAQARHDYPVDDELGALTGAFVSKSFEKSGPESPKKGADAEAKSLLSPRDYSAENHVEDVDPYETAFFQQETVSDDFLPTPTYGSSLRLQVQLPSQDPIGASPMKWDVLGHPALTLGFRDPVGESPMHDWKPTAEDVEDPPLSAGFFDDDDSFGEEEKKEDIETKFSLSSEGSATPFEKDFLSETATSAPELKNSSTSKATRAALKLASVTGLDPIKETVDSVPASNSGEEAKLVGLPPSTTPEGDSKSSEKEFVKIAPVETDVEKAGFKSVSNTPVSGKPALSVTTAAFTNAKAVAYLHEINGEPSPRHSWHAGKREKSDLSPLVMKAKTRKSKAKKDQPSAKGSAKKPSPDEYGAHNFDETLVSNGENMTPRSIVKLDELHAVKTKEGALFGAYNSKFQGRKPSKKSAPPKVETPTGNRLSLTSRGRLSFSEDNNKKNDTLACIEIKPGKITAWAVAKGISLRRSKRDDNILSGKSERVVITPRVKTEGRNRFTFFPQDESDIKDPIQRAGRRILSKSAVPIQCAGRKYIAKRQAIDRMWALMVIQSYYRRWRAEANLQAIIHSAVQIQSISRGWLARDQLKDMHSSAMQIQKIVRGYICQARVYDTMYYIVRVQALFKGCYERKMQQQRRNAAIQIQKRFRGFKARLTIFQVNHVLPIQALYRGHKARLEFAIAIASVKLLQSTWRGYAARITFQIAIVDIIIAQSVVRRWEACRLAQRLKDSELSAPASIIQATWRGRKDRNDFKKIIAARKIQSVWRGFQCYTDYIFSLVDILVVQRTARVWLAKRAVKNIRQRGSAIKIQCCWRRHKAQSTLLYSMVHIIIVQSFARRFLSRFVVQKKRALMKAVENAEQERQNAAIAIQRIWRGFWGFSHYIIIQYEIVRLQAIVRGRLAHQPYKLKLGCAIVIQATIRRHLAKRVIQSKMVSDAMTESASLALRERHAAKRIQFWWRIVMDWNKEKKAALTIERFFIQVREEVDREIVRREQRKLMKKEKRRQKRRESDDKTLERTWLNTVDENTAVGEYSRDSRTESGSRSQSAPRLREAQQAFHEMPHRTPTLGIKKQVMSPGPSTIGQEVDVHGWPIQRVDSIISSSRPPADSIPMSTSEDHSEVSNITNPTFFNRSGPTGRYEAPTYGRQHPKDKRMSTDDYIKKYGSGGGLQSAPNRMTASGQPQHFFSDGGSVSSTIKNRPRPMPVVANLPIAVLPNSTSKNVPATPTSRSRSSSTPRSQSSPGSGPNGTPRSFSTPSSPGTRSKSSSTTPHNNYGGSGGISTPRGSASYQVPSPRIQVGFPPATPKSHKGISTKHHHIASRGTADTESQTTFSQNSISKASPRSRPDGHVVRHGNPVMVMKNYPDFMHCHSMEESQEVLYLDGAELGEGYGEV